MTSGHIYRQTTTSHSIMSKPCAVFRNRACVLVVAHPKKGQSTLFRHQSESRQVSPDPRGKCASPTDDLKPGSEPISNEMMVSLGLVLLNPQTAFRGLSEPRDNSFRKSPTVRPPQASMPPRRDIFIATHDHFTHSPRSASSPDNICFWMVGFAVKLDFVFATTWLDFGTEPYFQYNVMATILPRALACLKLVIPGA